jgi:hypothetical protein
VTGKQYADLVAAYVVAQFGERGVAVYREVALGKTVLGKNRRIDVFVIHEASGTALALECKYQGSPGTADEKIPHTLQDLQTLPMPSYLVYAGGGFSQGVLHMLAASPRAAYCLPDIAALEPGEATRELDHVFAVTFRWWDVVVRGKPAYRALTPRPPAGASERDPQSTIGSSHAMCSAMPANSSARTASQVLGHSVITSPST